MVEYVSCRLVARQVRLAYLLFGFDALLLLSKELFRVDVCSAFGREAWFSERITVE